jgi:anti-sigma B factor antagonist
VKILARRQDKITIFDISGDIDFASSPEVRQSVLREIQESRASRVMMNLSQVRYIDSSGVASLVEGLKASRDLGSRFVLFGLSTSAREVLQLSRLMKVFEVYDNEEQAMAS